MKEIIFFDETERAIASQAKFNARELLTFFLAAGTFGYCSDGNISMPAIRFWNYLKPQLAEKENEIAALMQKLVTLLTGKKELRLRKTSRLIAEMLCRHYLSEPGSSSPYYEVWETLLNRLESHSRKEKGKVYFDLWAFICGNRTIPQLKAAKILVFWSQLENVLAQSERAKEKAEKARKKAIEALESLDALSPAERHEAKNVIAAGL